ncbi:deoxyguanosinetriphosphate triphosphohydrolase family protein [Desulforhopalus singaporensis]|uniref:dGTPase n=1 Tax=Desulforhopalus singaporensis TaxID=91360 RepID=A0A1H0UKK4_9BACT|nr:HD domain-containing protein [Desulforhopalus singaporensis]SDP66842.1 dGTPase [Desulforhopalus singaporensis]
MMPPINSEQNLMEMLNSLNREEEHRLSRIATKSADGIRRNREQTAAYRQQFALDADRILHSRAYMRYIDKTQVFSLVKNDHITHRVLHVQLVARIARTIGRFLRLNEDLIEAIALGHDIGHPPFGHDGESFLAEICRDHGLPPFQHNIQSVRFLDQLERKGRGWNLTLQVLDGILCHDGETHAKNLTLQPIASFAMLDRKLKKKSLSPAHNLLPATPEGCVVRLADTIAYIGKDIEDAIILGLITRNDLPTACTELLGSTNGTIVYNLVTDIISRNSAENTPSGSDYSIGFSKDIADALKELKVFNYQRIYLAPETKELSPMIGECYRSLFNHYLEMLQKSPETLGTNVDLMTDISPLLEEGYSDEEKVRDFIAGMTDNFFIREAAAIGCRVPPLRQAVFFGRQMS